MTIQLKSASARPVNGGLTVVHHAVNPGVLISAIAATTNDQGRQTSLGVRRAGDVRWLCQNISTNVSSASSLTPEKVLLQAGDELVATSDNTFVQRILPISAFPASGRFLICNPDASIQVCADDGGLFTSTDGQVTAVKTYSGSLSSSVCGQWINGAFRIYTSATTSLVSADGQVWATVACTKAPYNISAAATGGLVTDGAAFYGLQTATQVVKTNDGITWTNHAPALAANCASLAWSGTHLIAGNNAANGNVYRSLAGAAWGIVLVLAGESIKSIASNAAGTLALSLTSLNPGYTSTNHGAAWVSNAGSASNFHNALMMWTGARFVSMAASFVSASPTAAPYSFETQSGITTFYCVGGGKAWGINAVADAALTKNGGCTVTASIMEVL